MDIQHVPDRELAIADELSRIEGYPSTSASHFESDIQSSVADGSNGSLHVTAGGDDNGNRQSREPSNLILQQVGHGP